MRHWTQLGTAPIPGSDKCLMLFKSKDDFHIKLEGGIELMSTRRHGSEDALGTLPCSRLQSTNNARVLIGGLGMGFTLAAVLASTGENARVTVAELIPEVVEWNRGPLGEISGYPVNDSRCDIQVTDVCDLIKYHHDTYNVIALDVDNGPEGLTHTDNNWLYNETGILAARKALRADGVIAYWSASVDNAFSSRLKKCGLKVEEVRVFAHGNKGTRHTIWLAQPSRQKSA